MTTVTWPQVHAFRLRRHYLSVTAAPQTLMDVVERTCGIQAQVMSAAHLALRTRHRTVTMSAIERALWQDRDLVKVWSMRGTLHFLSARELPLYVAALKPYRLRQERRWMIQQGVEERAIDAMADAILAALDDGPLTRRQLTAALLPRLQEQAPQIQRLIEHGWGGLGKYACLRGEVCLGPNQGQEATFVRRDQHLATWEDIPHDAAALALLRRYLQAYGPATLQDFAFWAGMSVKDARQVWLRLEGDVRTVEVEGSAAGIFERDLPELMNSALTQEEVHLLPNFDVFLLGHRSKAHLVDDARYKRIFRAAGWISPVLVIDGRVAGVWSYKKKGEVMRFQVESFAKLTRRQSKAIAGCAANLAEFFQASHELTFTGKTG